MKTFRISLYLAGIFCQLLAAQVRLDTTPQQTTAAKDPDALVLSARALASMSSSPVDIDTIDSVATGNVIVQGQSMPIVLKTKGTRMMRSEVQKPKGSHVMVINNGRGQITQSDGKVRNLLMNGTYGIRPLHMPALSLLAEYQKSDVEITKPEQSVFSGKSATVLSFSIVPQGRTPEESDLFRKQTRAQFFIDPDSGIVQKMEFSNPAENDPDFVQKTAVVYSDYRQVGSLLLPFHITTYVEGELESDIVLDSIKLNVGLADSDFQITAEVKQ